MRLHSRHSSFPRAVARGLLLGSVLAAGTLTMSVKAQGDNASEDGPVVSTAEGPIRGFVKNGVGIFLGIPYAAPPVGNLRWRPPQAVEHWHAPRDATQFGSSCPQVTELGAFAGPGSINEDCLYLNVFTSNFGHNGSRNPVLVWIHGGGNVDGESSDYDGSKLATGGPIGRPTVVVTMNYRMGLFGFLAHPALDNEGHPFGNYGILDQQAVLRWVQRNIEAFGGDPGRVTLGGQSAGAIDTGASMLSPMATGLFQRAIFQSAPVTNSFYVTLSDALSKGTAFATAAGCPGQDAAAASCLRALSAPRILQLSGTPNANGPYVGNAIIDGTIIPIEPEVAYTTGQFNRMPILGGNTKDELTFGNSITEYFSGPPQVSMTAAQYEAAVNASYPPAIAAEVLTQYPLSNYASPQLAWAAVGTDPFLACPARHVVNLWAKWVPVYQYEFAYQNAPYYFPDMPGFSAAAAHTIDIQFVFPNWHGGVFGVNSRALNAQETKLSDQLVAAWTNFARTGNPNGSGNSPWPQFSSQAGAKTILSENLPSSSLISDADFAASHHCTLWDPLLGF
ncbi:MAG TPA: carboxylesterase family protein [Steroidobacteraceae bacterium]|nr:carboxylesterase family protein [Steroidobacteraceae bacterium]